MLKLDVIPIIPDFQSPSNSAFIEISTLSKKLEGSNGVI